MRYVGGKSRVAKSLAGEILRRIPDTGRPYYEPFMGGGAMLAEMAPHFTEVYAGDTHLDLMMMWSGLQTGWRPPESITLETYHELKDSPPSALRGAVGFGGSFGGKWFGGFARGGYKSGGSPRDYFNESYYNLIKTVGQFPHAELKCQPYSEWSFSEGSVVYCDPPYSGTLGYGDNFDSTGFWDWAADLSERAYVFVSEYEAPDGWVEVYRKSLAVSIKGGASSRAAAVDKLFTRGKSLEQWKEGATK